MYGDDAYHPHFFTGTNETVGRMLQELIDTLRTRAEVGFRGVLSFHVNPTNIGASVTWEPSDVEIDPTRVELKTLLSELVESSKDAGPRISDTRQFDDSIIQQTRDLMRLEVSKPLTTP